MIEEGNQEVGQVNEAESKEVVKKSRVGAWKEESDPRGNGARTHGVTWWMIEESAYIVIALSTDTHKGWWLLMYLNIGEAANPGPEHRTGIRLWSANVTSLSKRWQSMVSWETDIMVLQETRLGAEAQRIMNMRISQDGKVPLFGDPMPLKQKKD